MKDRLIIRVCRQINSSGKSWHRVQFVRELSPLVYLNGFLERVGECNLLGRNGFKVKTKKVKKYLKSKNPKGVKSG
jgi:hypothetical protein